MEEEPEGKEELEVEKEAQSSLTTIITKPQETISNDLNYLFRHKSRNEIRRVYGIQRDNESPGA